MSVPNSSPPSETIPVPTPPQAARQPESTLLASNHASDTPAEKQEQAKNPAQNVIQAAAIPPVAGETKQETQNDVRQKSAYLLHDNAIPARLSPTPVAKQNPATDGIRQTMDTAQSYVRNAMTTLMISIRSQMARNKYYPLISIVFLLVLGITVLSLYLTYTGSPTLLKAAANSATTASLSAQLLTQTATQSAEAKKPVEITWISDLHNTPGNSVDFYKGFSASESGKILKNSNTGDETFNRKNAPDLKAAIIGNFTLETKVLMNDPLDAETEKVFAIQILEYTPDPTTSPYIELRQLSQRGSSRFSILTEGLDKRINSPGETADAAATPSSTLVKPTVLGVSEETSALATSSAYLQVQRGSGNIMFKTSPDGKSWNTVGQRLVNNLTKQVTVRLFVYSPSKNPVSAIVQNLSVITKTNTTKDAVLSPSVDGRNTIQQWAYKARASSDYSNNLWSSMQATGEPNTTTCGDHPTAWASKTATGKEWLEVIFQKPVIPTQIRIRESNNPGHIYLVEVRNGTENFIPIWKDADLTDCNEDLVIPVTDVISPISSVKISLDETNQNDWSEIDAVSLIGYEE